MHTLKRLVPGLSLTTAGLAPFLLAGLVWRHDGQALAGPGLIDECPMLGIFGIPCIGCGGARAFFHLTHGGEEALSFNWFWPLAAGFAVVYGIVLVTRAVRGAELFGRPAREVWRRFGTQPVRMALATVAVLAVPWIVALSNLDAIRSG